MSQRGVLSVKTPEPPPAADRDVDLSATAASPSKDEAHQSSSGTVTLETPKPPADRQFLGLSNRNAGLVLGLLLAAAVAGVLFTWVAYSRHKARGNRGGLVEMSGGVGVGPHSGEREGRDNLEDGVGGRIDQECGESLPLISSRGEVSDSLTEELSGGVERVPVSSPFRPGLLEGGLPEGLESVALVVQSQAEASDEALLEEGGETYVRLVAK